MHYNLSSRIHLVDPLSIILFASAPHDFQRKTLFFFIVGGFLEHFLCFYVFRLTRKNKNFSHSSLKTSERGRGECFDVCESLENVNNFLKFIELTDGMKERLKCDAT